MQKKGKEQMTSIKWLHKMMTPHDAHVEKWSNIFFVKDVENIWHMFPASVALSMRRVALNTPSSRR